MERVACEWTSEIEQLNRRQTLFSHWRFDLFPFIDSWLNKTYSGSFHHRSPSELSVVKLRRKQTMERERRWDASEFMQAFYRTCGQFGMWASKIKVDVMTWIKFRWYILFGDVRLVIGAFPDCCSHTMFVWSWRMSGRQKPRAFANKGKAPLSLLLALHNKTWTRFLFQLPRFAFKCVNTSQTLDNCSRTRLVCEEKVGLIVEGFILFMFLHYPRAFFPSSNLHLIHTTHSYSIILISYVYF